MAEPQPYKLAMPVRSRSPAPCNDATRVPLLTWANAEPSCQTGVSHSTAVDGVQATGKPLAAREPLVGDRYGTIRHARSKVGVHLLRDVLVDHRGAHRLVTGACLNVA